jgi:hypothetical protein
LSLSASYRAHDGIGTIECREDDRNFGHVFCWVRD